MKDVPLTWGVGGEQVGVAHVDFPSSGGLAIQVDIWESERPRFAFALGMDNLSLSVDQTNLEEKDVKPDDTRTYEDAEVFWSRMENILKVHFPSLDDAEHFFDTCSSWLKDRGHLSVADVLRILNGRAQSDANTHIGWTSLMLTSIEPQSTGDAYVLTFPHCRDIS